MVIRFSDYFKLGKAQSELDFVDIPLYKDIPLFVDPYALSLEDDPWFVECSDLVVDFFQLVVDSIRLGKPSVASALLSHLHEPNETHLGFSGGRPAGRGIGRDQARDLYKRIEKSKAVKTGILRDLEDCELVIPGIGSDKISDMTINIIRGKLIEYTESQCLSLGIPTRRVSAGLCWDADREAWASRYGSLPIWNERRIILVPKAAVRHRLAVDYEDYYDFILEYLQAEHLDASTSLVTLLKNGRRVVRKKDLREKYPPSKEFVQDFSEQHPEVLGSYKKSLTNSVNPLLDESIEERQPEPRPLDIASLITELDSIPPGHKSAAKYHDFIRGALESIFYPQLRKPVKEQEINQGRKRVDIVFNNSRRKGFFPDLSSVHHIICPYVFFECKNYSEDPENPEFDQLAGRFSDRRGRFGVLVCRSVEDKEKMVAACRDVIHDGRGYIIVLDDADIRQLLELRSKRDYTGLNDYLDDKYRQLVL